MVFWAIPQSLVEDSSHTVQYKILFKHWEEGQIALCRNSGVISLTFLLLTLYIQLATSCHSDLATPVAPVPASPPHRQHLGSDPPLLSSGLCMMRPSPWVSLSPTSAPPTYCSLSCLILFSEFPLASGLAPSFIPLRGSFSPPSLTLHRLVLLSGVTPPFPSLPTHTSRDKYYLLC